MYITDCSNNVWFVVLRRICDDFAHGKKTKDGKTLCRKKKKKKKTEMAQTHEKNIDSSKLVISIFSADQFVINLFLTKRRRKYRFHDCKHVIRLYRYTKVVLFFCFSNQSRAMITYNRILHPAPDI